MAKEKILVVDDKEDFLELVRYNLSREGYQVTVSLTGEDALRKVRSDTFDLIVLDLMLPGMDGLADAMNQMAAQLDNRIETIVRQRNQLETVLASMLEGVIAVDSH